MNPRLVNMVLVSVILVSVASKNLWPYFYTLMYFQGAAVAWLLACGLIVYLLPGRGWSRKIALILFWWSASDVIELFFMDRTAFDVNEYITAILTVLIIFSSNGKRKKRNGRIQRIGYR